MSEQAKALKELAERIGWCAYGPGTEEGTPERQANVEGAVLSVMHNYHLIPDANAVVTEEGLAAAGDAVVTAIVTRTASVEEMQNRDLIKDRQQGMIIARAALKVAGIMVCNEVVKED